MYPFQTNSIDIPSPDWLQFNNSLVDSEINIFRLFVSNHLHQLALYKSLLNSQELFRASKFFKCEDRERFIISRAVLKKLLGLCTNLAPQTIVIVSDKNEKPILKDCSHIHFNISHSKNCITFAISNKSVGIDVEYLNENFNYRSIIEACFTVSEIYFIKESPKPVRDFFKLWTRKEAFLKAIGKGLNDDMNKLNCLSSFPANEIEVSDYNNYTIRSFGIEKEYIASIAYQCEEKQLLFYEI